MSNGSYLVAVFATFPIDFFSLCANLVLFAKLIFENDSPFAPIPACAPIQILRVVPLLIKLLCPLETNPFCSEN